MGAGTLVMGWINRVVRGARAEDVTREEDEKAAEVARALRTTEELRTGKSRMLTVDETNRVFEKLERKWGRR
ncbi:MAG: hypothetical protein OXU79_15410 [Gemmatimonadota bacterium]|nr:hypothetical protein [Gemmatimonadota bacterium]